MNISVIPYLSFLGDCEEAVNTYISVFGGKVLYISHWDENNCENVSQIGKVMHIEFLIGETRMSGGDSYDFSEMKNTIKLMVHMETKEKALNSIEILKEEGEIISPLKPHPAPDDGGMGSIVKDKFGYTWIITCPNPDKK